MSYPLVIRLMHAMALMPDASYCESLGRLAGLLADVPFALEWHVPTEKVAADWRVLMPADVMEALFWRAAGPLIDAVAFGRLSGGYRYIADAVDAMHHQRSVEWISDGIPRDAIDQDLLYSLGAFLTVCQISRNDAERRIKALLDHQPHAVPDNAHMVGSTTVIEPDDVTDTAVDLAEIGRDQIRRRLADRFKGHELARLVGELLKAEGFVCEVSPAGPDGGVDVLAGQGGMGFDDATMAVQVKSGSTVVDAPTLRELKGVMGNFGAKRGLLVSWGGFTKIARQEARRLFFEIRLWHSNAVIDKLQEVYGHLPADVQAEIPLQRVWTLLPDQG